MKKIIGFSLVAAIALVACKTLDQAVGEVNKQIGGTTGGVGLSNAEIINGLKDALTQGTNKSSSRAAQMDGFNKNPKIRITFPRAFPM